jgi:hypothetical protein
MSIETYQEVVKLLLEVKVLVEQVRDNSRFDNWVYFPGNSVEYSYTDGGVVEQETLLRHGKVVLRKKYTYDTVGNIVRITVG